MILPQQGKLFNPMGVGLDHHSEERYYTRRSKLMFSTSLDTKKPLIKSGIWKNNITKTLCYRNFQL